MRIGYAFSRSFCHSDEETSGKFTIFGGKISPITEVPENGSSPKGKLEMKRKSRGGAPRFQRKMKPF